MGASRIECHLPHGIDVVGTGNIHKHWDGREYYPRAAEVLTLVGRVAVAGVELPVLRQRFGGLINADGIPYDPNTLSVVSYETIAAAARQNLPIDRLAFPFGIVRVTAGPETGKILGCRGLGIVEPSAPPRPVGPALSDAELQHLPPTSEWRNFANFPMNFLNPADVADDDVLPDGSQPLLTLPAADTPIDITFDAQPDEQLTEQFDCPIYRVGLNPGIPTLHGMPPQEGEVLNFVHPFVPRVAARLGHVAYRTATLGVLARRPNGTLAGGRAIAVYDHAMLSRDTV